MPTLFNARSKISRLAFKFRLFAAKRRLRRAAARRRQRVAFSLVHGTGSAQQRCHQVNSMIWWVPRDAGKSGSLSVRVLAGDLPLDAMLRTRPFIRTGAMIDIGANIGTTAIPRLILGDATFVYAIEPEPENHSCLTRNALENGVADLMRIDQVALADRDGEAQLRRANAIGRHRLMPSDSRVRRDAVTVRSMTLDSWARWAGCKPSSVSYVKIDTQGWETQILRGASSWLKEQGVVWEIEVCPRLLDKAHSSVNELYEILEEHFDWFIELRAQAEALQLRPIRELRTVVARSLSGPRNYTNVLVGHSS